MRDKRERGRKGEAEDDREKVEKKRWRGSFREYKWVLEKEGGGVRSYIDIRLATKPEIR